MWKLALNCCALTTTLLSGQLALAAITEPCSLLTADEVGTALGLPVAAGSPLTHGCAWHAMGRKGAGKRVNISLQPSNLFDVGKTPIPGAEKPAVSGLGDDAYFMYMTDARYSKLMETGLNVKKGGQALVIQVWGFATEEGKQKAKAIAVAALARM